MFQVDIILNPFFPSAWFITNHLRIFSFFLCFYVMKVRFISSVSTIILKYLGRLVWFMKGHPLWSSRSRKERDPEFDCAVWSCNDKVNSQCEEEI